MTKCPFSVIAKETSEGWALIHRPDRQFASHNHEPSLHPSAHPVLRQLSQGTGTGAGTPIAPLSSAGLAPREIQTLVRQSGSLQTRQDIYNRIAEARHDSREGESPIHAFWNQLEKKGFWSHVEHIPDGYITSILFIYPESLAYLQTYPEILILDCTYKTNKYGMPLLDMIGIDVIGRSFYIAFTFLSGEAERDYIWTLERL